MAAEGGQIPDEAFSTNSALETAKDLTAGATGGVVQVLIGQPFDLVKVRLQTAGEGGIIRTIQGIWTKEGPLAFYKGTLVPLIGIGACVSIQFGAFSSVQRVFEARNQRNRQNGDHSISFMQAYSAGGVAGLANSVLAGPIEHIRIRLQMQPDGAKRLYNGPVDCMRKIVQQNGISGLFRGQGITLIREWHGFGVWFATYEALVALTSRWSGQKRNELPGWKVALCGGVAGDALWLAVYPFDVIKTKLQSDNFGPQRRYQNTFDVVKQTWRAHRYLGFFSGLIPTLVRTVFTSAGTFVAVEYVKRALE